MNSLYCVDIDYSAIIITKLRFWLSLIIDEDNVEEDIESLPNLDNNIICGNSLIDTFNNIKLFNKDSHIHSKNDPEQFTLDYNTALPKLKKINDLKEKFFDETIIKHRKKLKNEINKLKYAFIEEYYSLNGGDYKDIKQYEFKDDKPFVVWELEFSEVFLNNDNPGFDIIIGNPPYVSNKGIKDKEIKKTYEKLYGIRDDLYNYFFIKGFKLLKEGGVLAYITSNTYFTINSKKNLRELFQNNEIIEIMVIVNVFKDPMVQPAIMIFKKNKNCDDYEFNFIDAKNSFNSSIKYNVNIKLYKHSLFKVFFTPTNNNIFISKQYFDKINTLHNKYWNKINTSKKISKFQKELNNYRSNLKEHDVTLLGLITDGGQGLATGNNGKFIGVLEGTRWVDNILKTRPLKLFKAIEKYHIPDLKWLNSKSDVVSFLNSLSEYGN